MVAAWICGAVAVGGIIATAISGERYRRKYNKLKGEYDNRCTELEIEKKEVNDLNTAIEAIRDRVLALLDEGHKNLSISEESNAVLVIGTCPDKTGLVFLVKKIPFDPNDPSDRDFAIRRAEELIEIIQTI